MGVDEHAGGQRAHVGDPLGEFGRGGGVHGQRQPDLEQAALAAGDPVGQGVGVLGGGVGVRVEQPAVFGVGAPPGLEPGQLPAQPRRRGGGVDRGDVQADVQPPGVAG